MAKEKPRDECEHGVPLIGGNCRKCNQDIKALGKVGDDDFIPERDDPKHEDPRWRQS